VLCVVFRGKPTHHLIAKTPEGVYAINKKTYGGHKNVGAVRLHLPLPPRPPLMFCQPDARSLPECLSLKPRRRHILTAKLSNTPTSDGTHTHTHTLDAPDRYQH